VDIDTKSKKVTRREIIINPHLGLEKGKGIKVAQFLLGYKPDVIVTREQLSGKGPGYAFPILVWKRDKRRARMWTIFCPNCYLAQASNQKRNGK
jgi:hypothetical protein